MKKEQPGNTLYEVHKKICRKTGKVLEESRREVPGDPEEYTEALVNYVASITENKEEK